MCLTLVSRTHSVVLVYGIWPPVITEYTVHNGVNIGVLKRVWLWYVLYLHLSYFQLPCLIKMGFVFDYTFYISWILVVNRRSVLSSALSAVCYRNTQTHKEISLLLLSVGRLSVIIYYYTFLLLLFSLFLLFSISLQKSHVLENWYVRNRVHIVAVHVCICILNPNVLRNNESRASDRLEFSTLFSLLPTIIRITHNFFGWDSSSSSNIARILFLLFIFSSFRKI